MIIANYGLKLACVLNNTTKARPECLNNIAEMDNLSLFIYLFVYITKFLFSTATVRKRRGNLRSPQCILSECGNAFFFFFICLEPMIYPTKCESAAGLDFYFFFFFIERGHSFHKKATSPKIYDTSPEAEGSE